MFYFYPKGMYPDDMCDSRAICVTLHIFSLVTGLFLLNEVIERTLIFCYFLGLFVGNIRFIIKMFFILENKAYYHIFIQRIGSTFFAC